ncbi:MAG: metallophosphoesterase, partial [Candidatus Lokiarchaeota archaeon]|nr:metallophosphoesterase [Candidatus Lokiarchaeota archaeon]
MAGRGWIMQQLTRKASPFVTIACMVLLACLVLSLSSTGARDGTPGSGTATRENQGTLNPSGIDTGSHNVFWFLHVTDSQECWLYGDAAEDPGLAHQYFLLLNESARVIVPEFVVNTGDLVNTNDHDGNIIADNLGQDDVEWAIYRNATDSAGANLSWYVDLTGNHDGYGDPGFTRYLANSVLGRATGQYHHAWGVNTSAGQHRFIGLKSTEGDGVDYQFAVFGILTRAEMDWYEAELRRETGSPSPVTFLLQHHPPYSFSAELTGSGKSFESLAIDHGVDVMLVGHHHVEDIDYLPQANGIRAIQTPAFHKDRGTYRILAVDSGVLSSELAFVGRWPQGLITSPIASDHVYGDYLEAPHAAPGAIRVLAWDVAGVTGVQIRIDGGAWQDATQVTGPLWELLLPVGSPSKMHIESRITGGSGEKVVSIDYDASAAPGWTWFHWMVLLYAGVPGTIGACVAFMLVRRFKYPAKFGKKPDQRVDRGKLKLFLIFCAVFVAVPLVMGNMFGDPTLLFALGFVRLQTASTHFTWLLLTITGVHFLASVLPVG